MSDMLVGLGVIAAVVILAAMFVCALASWIGIVPVLLIAAVLGGLIWLSRDRY